MNTQSSSPELLLSDLAEFLNHIAGSPLTGLWTHLAVDSGGLAWSRGIPVSATIDRNWSQVTILAPGSEAALLAMAHRSGTLLFPSADGALRVKADFRISSGMLCSSPEAGGDSGLMILASIERVRVDHQSTGMVDVRSGPALAAAA